MVVPSKDAKVEVTVNGSGFDTPSEVGYSNDGEIPTCRLIFPAGQNARYKILKSDVVRVFIGLDDTPDIPQFTGHLPEELGTFDTEMELVGSLNRAVVDKRFVTDFSNFDGQEIGTAIRAVFNEVSELSFMSIINEETSPIVVVPDDLRFESGISKYDLLKQFRELAVDSSDPLRMGRYTLFQHGDFLHFRKIPNPATASAWVELAYGDTLLDFVPESNTRFSYNYSRVRGKDGVIGEFQNDHRINVDGLSEADIISDENIPSAGEAYEVARATVLDNMVNQAGLEVSSHLLLEAIPNFTVIEVSGAPFGLSAKYLVRTIDISVSEGQFDVSAKVNVPVDILSESLSQLLNISGSGSAALALQ